MEAIVDYSAELDRSNHEAEEAEDALMASGFSAEQWLLIKQYIHSAIYGNQVAVARALQELPPRPDSDKVDQF